MKMNRRRQAARHGNQVTITMINIASDFGNSVINRRNLDPRNAVIAIGGNDGMALQNFDASITNRTYQRAGCVFPKIGDHNKCASMMKIKRGAIGVIIIANNDGALSRTNAIAVDIGANCAGKHNTGKIIACKNQWPFMGTLRDDHLFCADFPQTLAWQMRWA